ncbi:MAG: porin, partial [Bacteroidaceae bacterium]|nr:porin [Bacteroidaceae bacterium]
KIKPSDINIMMYDGGINFHKKGLHIEAEYLLKKYSHNAYKDVHAIDAFASYDIPTKREDALIKYITPLVRYDFMTDHSDGIRYLDGKEDATGTLKTNDYKRGRLTGGVTLSLNKPFISDIRINYEKYFYSANAQPKTSERDKFVVEFMTRF